jgi:hypothetical protein
VTTDHEVRPRDDDEELLMKRWRVALVTATVAGLAATTAAVPAVATSGTGRAVSASDPDDVGNRLDIVHERFRLNGDGTVTMRIRTAETWRCGYLQSFGDGGEPYSAALLWEFDESVDGELGDPDFVGVFSCGESGGLVFRLHHTSGAYPVRAFQASRPNARSASVTIPRRALHAQHVELRARSRFDGTTGNHTAFDEEDTTPILRGY